MPAQAVKSSDPLLAAWAKIVARKGDAPAIYDTRGKVARTFIAIEETARGLQDKLRAQGGDDVYPIDLGNDPDWPAHLLAALRLGRVALPMDESTSAPQREAILTLCRAHAQGWEGERPALLKLTSGTTAAPRAIRFTSAQLLADCDQICATMGLTEADLNFGVIPVSHSYGLSNLITPLLARGIPLVMSRDRMPRAVLDDMARTAASVFAGMPIFYQAFCELEDPPVLPRLRLCISAGAPLPLSIARRFRARFGQTIHSFYGSSECGGICYDRDGLLETEGYVGAAMEGVQIERLDATAAMSQVRVTSAAAGDGYFPEPDEAKLGGGHFIPDDLLAKEGPGYRIAGRVSDLINVAGRKVNPAEVEAALNAFPGVRAAIAFGRESALRNEEVTACVVASAEVSEAQLLDHCRRRLSGWQVPKRLFFLEELPVNERGKISRRALAERFAGR